MKIAVVGAGAMGSLFGGLLAEAVEDVTLVDVWREHVETINSWGLRIRDSVGDRTVDVKATSTPGEVGVVDLMIIFVKSYDTAQAARDAIPMIGEKTIILSLQNGIGNVEKIKEAVGERVVRGVTSHGSTLLGPGEIYHAGSGHTTIGELDGSITQRIQEIRDVLDSAGIATDVSGNVMGALWNKVFANVGINPLTALTGLRNGELLEHPEIKEVMRRAVEEAYEVAVAMGIDVGEGAPVEGVYEVASITYENKSSMLQDVERGRRTEIDALNGAIVDLGKVHGVETPVNETLTAVVKGLERVRAGAAV